MNKSPRLSHRIYAAVRPTLQDIGVLRLARKLFPQSIRTAAAIRLGLSGFDIYAAQGQRRRQLLKAARSPRRRLTGVNYLGDLRASLGLTENSRRLVRAIQAAGVPINYTELAYPLVTRSNLPPELPTGMPHDMSIVDMHQHYLYDVLCNLPLSAITYQYRIGFWHWELDRLPPETRREFDLLHEIWTNNHFVRDAIARDATIPVIVMPPVIQCPVVPENPRRLLNLPEDRFIFLFSFDPLSTFARKNPFAVIEAFRRAFAGRHDRALLVLKAHHLNLPENREGAAALREAMNSVAGVLMEDYLDRDAMNGLLAACDCYVSLHRSEGFGFGMAEAMLLGKPVIATAYSGNLDFMTGENSYGVRCTVRPIQESDHRYQPDMVRIYPLGYNWAEPDIDHAAALMRQVYDHPDEARRRGQKAARDVASMYSLQAAAQHIRDRLEAIAHG